MGQAGAQREPSMEEILASIRRIIENNEPGPAESEDAYVPHEADEARIDADYAEQEAESQRTAANDASVAQPVSLADVAARARATPDSHFTEEVTAQPAAVEQPAAAEQPAAKVLAREADFIDIATEKLREALNSDEPVRPAATAAVKDEPKFEGSATEERLEEQPVEAPFGHDEKSTSQLVSLHTGEKVAAAFGELDAAVAAGQQRSFDEIAEEMLRPMLTHWLDDNLPTLVERLVREEIERVSRGNRR